MWPFHLVGVVDRPYIVTDAHRLVALILLGVAMLALAVVILARNRNLDVDLLAVLGLIGGAAIVVVCLPRENR